ncbi:glycosyltransferase [Algoriphagus aestuariicola]|jgi:glycosyltransferase involved in cell wall biosynthesis|uniref:Glycosyltransferase n=1 Tax=Algoriphagus aestuariicola TaxID=1852016 RepID=A0ABS3BLM4_9BACT|nr:glycosyltransferase [Algoriphagus aestuariicola]MBN7799912.1 glycosyltransferase [Algoriphagus aestuariicola]
MRVLQLIDSLDVGGGERMAVNLANYFSENQIPNLLISTRKGGPLEKLIKSPNSLEVFSKSNVLDLATFIRILRKVRSFDPSIIHAHDSSIFWAALIKLLYPKAMLVWHAHYGGFSSANGRFGKKIKFLQAAIDRVIVVNSELLAWVKSDFSMIPKAAYIGNFPDRVSECHVEREKLKWIISVANLKKPKNHVVLVRAFSEFIKSHTGYKLALIGTMDDPEYVEEVNRVIQAEDVQEHVHLLGPVMELKEWFDKARMGILSSHVEGLPVSLLELGLSGVPVISSRVGACGDLLEAGRCGYLVEPNDSGELSMAMRNLVDNKEETRVKAMRFENKVKTEFGGDSFFRKYSALLGKY